MILGWSDFNRLYESNDWELDKCVYDVNIA